MFFQETDDAVQQLLPSTGIRSSALNGEFTDAEKVIGLLGSANCRFRNIPVGQADSEGAQTKPLILS